MTKNIILIGMRGTGKSLLGKILAKKTKKEFIDTDKEIVKQEKRTIQEIVERDGWESFREKEKNVIARISLTKNSVIATGGGAILNEQNVRHLKRNGFFLLLIVPIKTILQRIQHSKKRPPLTEAKSKEKELYTLWEERKKLYHSLADAIYHVPHTRTNSSKELGRKMNTILRILETSSFPFKASPIFTNRKGVCVTTKAKNGNKEIRKDVDKEESGLKF